MRILKLAIDAMEMFVAVIIVVILSVIVIGACALAYPLRLLLDWQAKRSRKLCLECATAMGSKYQFIFRRPSGRFQCEMCGRNYGVVRL